MKKLNTLVVIILVMALLITGCGSKAKEVVEIPEKMFVTQINEIYLNRDEYLGKTIRYEGLYKNNLAEKAEDEREVHYVIRYSPGCCGYDGEAGFEVRWNGEWPQIDDWVEVVGVLKEKKNSGGIKVLYLELSTLTVKEERGAEFVAV